MSLVGWPLACLVQKTSMAWLTRGKRRPQVTWFSKLVAALAVEVKESVARIGAMVEAFMFVGCVLWLVFGGGICCNLNCCVDLSFDRLANVV